VLGRSGECLNLKFQGGGVFFERESKKERERSSCGLGRRRATGLSLRILGPTSARHVRTVRGALANSLRGARTVCHPGADGPLFARERPVLHLLPMSRADGPRRPGGRSARSGQTVRPTAVYDPTSHFNFSLKYSEIKI
jgi:hypothetical protein